MDYRMIKFSVSEQVATITLDYAPTLNALDLHMALELEDALKKSEESPDVSVVIITGAGRAFCGGGDIRYMKAHCEEPDFSKKSMGPLAGKLSEIVLYIKKMKKKLEKDEFKIYEIERKEQFFDELRSSFYNKAFNELIVNFINSCE